MTDERKDALTKAVATVFSAAYAAHIEKGQADYLSRKSATAAALEFLELVGREIE